ncbi:MAG TPA: hypothetical protein VK540_24975 [Polyangiaceae bacterium]|nr:hypothetical protein [Polyangiaceae bacterium]
MADLHGLIGAWCLVLLCGCDGRLMISEDARDAASSDANAGGLGGGGGSGGAGASATSSGAGGGSGTSGGGAGGVTSGTGGNDADASAGSSGTAGGSAGRAGFGGVGGSAGSSLRDGGAEAGLPPWPNPVCPAGSGSPLLGTWVGYVENYKFASGSDAVRVTILGADDATLCGTITFGTNALPPPPQDADVGYPVGMDFGLTVPALSPLEGFPHTLQSGSIAGKRGKFEAILYEPWKAWCALQHTTYLWYDDTFSCVSDWLAIYPPAGSGMPCAQTNPGTNESVPIDCGKLSLCGRSKAVCACDLIGCTAQPKNGSAVFDGQFIGGEATGTIKLPSIGMPLVNVYLQKSE